MPTPSSPSIAPLCDTVIEALLQFPSDSPHITVESREDFAGELEALKKFFDLIERVRRAKPPQTELEEDHWAALHSLMVRCRHTLSSLRECLSSHRGSKEYELHYNEPWKISPTLVEERKPAASVSTLRAHINLYTQTLQMSLQAINLVHQKRNKTSPETLHSHIQALSKALTDLKMVLSRRWSLIDRESEAKIVLDDALFSDVQRCFSAARAIVHTGHGETSPVLTSSTPARTPNLATHETPVFGLPKNPSPRRASITANPSIKELDVVLERKSTLEHHEVRAPKRECLQVNMEVDVDPRAPQRDSCTVEPLSIKRKEAPSIQEKALPKIIAEEDPDPDPSEEIKVHLQRDPPEEIKVHFQRDPFEDSNIKHQGSPIDDASPKHRGSLISESDTKHEGSLDSEEDPEPDFKETGFPPAVYAELISHLQQEVHREMKAENYDKAELAHLKAINYLTDREMTLQIPYDDQLKSTMNETLADIYVKQKQFDKAKNILSALLKQEKADSARKWRLYYLLAGVYLDQQRLPEAEKYAKRAYGGREKTLGKGHGLILQSAAQLVQIYEAKGEPEAAQAFKNLYDSASIKRNQTPQISKHIGTKRVAWNPDISVDINALQKNGETPLITAVTCCDDETLHRVLQSGANVEVRGADGMSPLMHAVLHGHEKIAEVLISRGAQVDAPTAGWTPLHKACDLSDEAMINLLLANGANIEAKSPKKLMIKKKKPPAAKPAEPTWSSDEDDSENNDADQGWTPLLRAASTGKEAIVRHLLDRNADIEARNPSKATPLICAAEGHHEAVIELLLVRGANIEAEDEFGWKPLHRTLLSKGGERVAQILLNHETNLNCTDLQRKTPLHHAVEKKDEEMACFLLRAGAFTELRDNSQRTPLISAIECRLENMVYVLLAFGADASTRDRNGRDALGAAQHAVRKSPEITKLLAKHKKNGGVISSGNSDNSSRRGSSRRESNAMSTASTAVSTFSGVSSAIEPPPIPTPPRSTVTSPRPESSSGASWWSRKSSKGRIKK